MDFARALRPAPQRGVVSRNKISQSSSLRFNRINAPRGLRPPARLCVFCAGGTVILNWCASDRRVLVRHNRAASPIGDPAEKCRRLEIFCVCDVTCAGSPAFDAVSRVQCAPPRSAEDDERNAAVPSSQRRVFVCGRTTQSPGPSAASRLILCDARTQPNRPDKNYAGLHLPRRHAAGRSSSVHPAQRSSSRHTSRDAVVELSSL